MDRSRPYDDPSFPGLLLRERFEALHQRADRGVVDAAADHRDVNEGLDFSDGVPVRFAAVALFLGPAVNGDEGTAVLLHDTGDQLIVFIAVPAQAELAGALARLGPPEEG